ncbi:NaeI family type II restriction endonuclease [Streptomyces sp. NPDC016845]|uniref:NaeI family type II restriction endonuclease n=1 Tax=Streptomyces sp. NPDC016845 TaxID=3364972 RepID=UPI00379CFBA7
MISRVTKVLAESGAELSHEELLDAIWLAGKLPRDSGPLARSVGVIASSSERHSEPHHDEPTVPADDTEPEPASEPTVAESVGKPSARPLLASARPGSDDDAQRPTSPSSAVALRIPDSSALGAGQLGLGRSLRPLRQRFPDRREQELDVPRTVAAIAETGVPETVTRAVRSRWLSLALVVDDGVSMVLWQRLAADVRALMERAGAFRDVRVYGLDARSGTPSLRTSPYRHRGRLLTPEALCDPSGNTLVLVVSDGVGEAWRDGGMRQVMDSWGRCGPTAIVQALPSRLWASTGIGARRWQVTTHRRGGPTHAWHVTDPDLPPDLVRFDSVPVPVLTPTPAAVADWAKLVASPGGTALLPLWEGGRAGSGRALDDTLDGDAAGAVLRYKEAASPEAYRLAAHIAAVTPVTPPVMRLVQAALGPPTDLGHLMEVFLGGLMHEFDADGAERLPHHRRYDFTDDARRLLLSAVSPRELLHTAEAVTRRIETAVGRAPVFPAWVGHPDGAAVVDDSGRSFGWLREQVLTRLGIPPAAGAGPVAPVPRVPLVAVPPAGWVKLRREDPVRLGRFRLRARSAKGWAHLTMYLAEDEDGTVATVRAPVRLYAREPGTARDLVRTEVECLSRMRGTHTPALLGAAAHTAGELPWIAASCVHRRADDPSSPPAPNLRVVLEEHGGTVPEELFLRIGLGLTEAVALAHSRGLVHGSISPRAVLVNDRDVRLVGWATATVDGVDSAHRGVLPLSDTYLQADDDGRSLTPQSDMYAVGALLLALLSGRWSDPRTDKSQRGPLTEHRAGPVLLRALLRRCLEQDLARRPSATDLAEAFAFAVSGGAAVTSEKTIRRLSRGQGIPAERGTLVEGRYRLVRRQRAGAVSTMWRATDEPHGRDVVLKLFTAPGGGEVSEKEKFFVGARRLAALDTEMVRVTGYGLHGGRQYLVTDAVDGEDLGHLLDTASGALPFETIREVGVQIAGVLAEYHRNGLLHLDLSPSALVLRPDGRVLLTDPGSGFPGLPHSADVTVDHRSDLYALGALLYAMATGAAPPATTARSPREAGNHRPPQPPPELPPGFPPEFAGLVMELLAVEPEDRPATADEVVERLTSVGTDDAELIAVHDAVREMNPDGTRMGRVLRDAIDHVLHGEVTGRYDLRQLTKAEIPYLGGLVPVAIQREFVLEDGHTMDFRVAGVEVDCRFSLKDGGWMFSPEMLGRICLLVWVDDYKSRWSAGLLRVRQEWLKTRRNSDRKGSLATEHRDKIFWLWRGMKLPENILLHMSESDREAVLGSESGQVRVNELFRRVQGRLIGVNTVRTVVRQKDYMRRVRGNGGSRSVLRDEGILILGDFAVHQRIAHQLGLPVPRDGEFVSARVVPAAPASGKPVAKVDGRLWSLASPEDREHPAPALPSH